MQVRTLGDLFLFTVSQRPRDDAFVERRDGRWVEISSVAFARDVASVGEALVADGLAPGDRVAILSENRYDWTVADFAVLTRGGITVPVYATLPAAPVRSILEHSGARVVFVSTGQQLAKLTADGLPEDIRSVIVFDDDGAGAPGIASMSELRRRGGDALDARGVDPFDVVADIEPTDLATIIYTSGTTGAPKGVMLSHGNLVANVADALASFPIGVRDRVLSYLPLSHVFERTAGQFVMFHAGASIAYAESPESVPRDAHETRPTIMLGVPRFFEKFNVRVLAAVAKASPLRRRLFEWACRVGEQALKERESSAKVSGATAVRYRVAKALVFRRIRARIGGRVRFFVSGSAPLRLDINRFFHCIGLPIYEGYGLTEASPVISANTPAADRIGSVGRHFPRVRMRIGEDGEIQAAGQSISRGYFRDAEMSRELFTSDGWLRTGDVGRIDVDGFLYITDRKKDIIVTAGGKNVAPQPIENLLRAQPHIADAMLVGDGRKFISALIVPDVQALAAEMGGAGGDRRSTLDDPRIRAIFEHEVEVVNAQLASFETIKRFHVVADELSVEDGSLTPTMKLKRRVLVDRYFREIDALYAEESA